MSAFGTKRTTDTFNQCLLLGVKRTSVAPSQMSAFDPKRTSSQKENRREVLTSGQEFLNG